MLMDWFWSTLWLLLCSNFNRLVTHVCHNTTFLILFYGGWRLLFYPSVDMEVVK